MTDTEVRDVPDQSAYEVTVDGGHAGWAYYSRGQGEVVFTHTEVDDAFEGQGVGSALARGALDDARARGEQVLPRCAFIAGWIAHHEDYLDLVPEQHHAAVRARG